MSVTPEQILRTLKRIRGPDLQGNIVELGLVSEVVVKDGRVSFSITVPPERAAELEPLRQAAQQVVSELPGVNTATVVLTADRAAGRGHCCDSAGHAAESPRVQRRVRRRAVVTPAHAGAHARPFACTACSTTVGPGVGPSTGEGAGTAAGRAGAQGGCGAGREAPDRGRLGQGRRRQVDGGGQSGAGVARRSGIAPASWMPTSTGRRKPKLLGLTGKPQGRCQQSAAPHRRPMASGRCRWA